MKTAIQELKDRLINIGFTNVDDFIEPYLETEKQQIIDAYDDGYLHEYHSSEVYYTSTFETNN